jgi:hypothetical protein
MKKKVIVIAIGLLLIVAGAAVIKMYVLKDAKMVNGKTVYEVEDYRHVEFGQVTCHALVPECGYCPGEVIDKKCYKEIN